MAARDLLVEAARAGVRLARRGSRLIWEADRSPPPDLLERLRAQKADVLAALADPGAPDAQRFDERAGVLEFDGGFDRVSAERLAALEQGFGDADALHAARVERWRRELDRLAEAGPATPFARRALEGAQAFAGSDWGIVAARLGWDELALFGVNADAPETRFGAWGLGVFLGAARSRPKLVALTDAAASLVTPTGARQRLPRWAPDRDHAVALWELNSASSTLGV